MNAILRSAASAISLLLVAGPVVSGGELREDTFPKGYGNVSPTKRTRLTAVWGATEGVEGPIRSVALSPDGKLAVISAAVGLRRKEHAHSWRRPPPTKHESIRMTRNGLGVELHAT